MAKNYVHTEIEGRKVKLSNLDKILYPSKEITKAQVIQYYLGISDYILPHIRDRALTVIRYPDGIHKQTFYSKDKPKWTPDWLNSIKIEHDEKTIDYVICDDKASLCWLANLACLELHPMQYQVTHQANPDHFIFDLDPDEDLHFDRVKEAAMRLKPFLEKYGYHAYLKTSGGKGLHLYVPIQPEWDMTIVSEMVKALAGVFVSQYGSQYTLQISKAKRKGKILIDIYRNHSTNTTVAPFSMRGKMGAPISMPIHWDQLDNLSSSNQFDITNYQAYLDVYGYAWKDWQDQAAMLHNHRLESVPVTELSPKLESYLEKRNFSNTPEPVPILAKRNQNRYCIQLHDASNLHYDLRLEHEGVLLSWAIPKGLPFQDDVKRLAIRTEDHPIKYLDFSGIIPKGEYGAGQMWICEKGKIEWIEKSDKKYTFRLSQRKGATFHLFRTKNNQWLINVKLELPYLQKKPKHMLAEASKHIPKADQYSYEVKWDGIRVFVILIQDRITILSKSGRDITAQFPELWHTDRFKVEQGLFDGEIVVLDSQGAPVFSDVISRMHTSSEVAVRKLSRRKPAVCYLFDAVQIDGRDIAHFTNTKRREWLDCVLKSGESYRFSDSFPDGAALFAAIESKGMEGIMAKLKDAAYQYDSRCRHWLKIKSRSTADCYIIGYTQGKGDRSAVFGALHLAQIEGDEIQYRGKVGTGFDMAKLRRLYELFSQVDKILKPIKDTIDDESRTVWIKPEHQCEITYASMTSNQTYREPVFVKLIAEL